MPLFASLSTVQCSFGMPCHATAHVDLYCFCHLHCTDIVMLWCGLIGDLWLIPADVFVASVQCSLWHRGMLSCSH